MIRFASHIVLIVLVLGLSEPAWAYVGPGAGLSLLGALWGLLAAIGAALLFVVLWPLRQLRKRRRAQRATPPVEGGGPRTHAPEDQVPMDGHGADAARRRHAP